MSLYSPAPSLSEPETLGLASREPSRSPSYEMIVGWVLLALTSVLWLPFVFIVDKGILAP